MSPKVKVVMLVQPQNALSPGYEPAFVQLSALKWTEDKPLQLLNASAPMEVTELPMVTEVKPLQL